MHEELKTLCSAGKRDEAMSKAMAFGKEVASNSALQSMQKCGQGMQGMLPPTGSSNTSDQPSHVCDSLNH